MPHEQRLPGKFVWFEHISLDAGKAQRFYNDVLGWDSRTFPEGSGYDMIFTGPTPDSMIGGYAAPKHGERPHWISYLSVDDVDAVARAAVAKGGTVIDPPADMPGVGRMARIADPQGAEISVYTNPNGDPPDSPATHGRWFWNELHTTDQAKAREFYEQVLGFSARAIPMGANDTYYIVSKGGVDRGGISWSLSPGQRPHWLPYVYVDDADAVMERAKQAGATVRVGPEDIPGIGRYGVFSDPAGALLAVMKPKPM